MFSNTSWYHHKCIFTFTYFYIRLCFVSAHIYRCKTTHGVRFFLTSSWENVFPFESFTWRYMQKRMELSIATFQVLHAPQIPRQHLPKALWLCFFEANWLIRLRHIRPANSWTKGWPRDPVGEFPAAAFINFVPCSQHARVGDTWWNWKTHMITPFENLQQKPWA